MTTNQTLLAIACLFATGCGWGPIDPALETELADLKTELAAVKAELAELRGDSDLQAELIAADLAELVLRPAERAAVQRRTMALANDVDADLGDQQDQLDDHADQLELLHLEVQAISEVVNVHAIEIDANAESLTDLDAQTAGLRTLEGVMSFEDGRVVIEGADVFLSPGTNPDGSPGTMGQVLNRVP